MIAPEHILDAARDFRIGSDMLDSHFGEVVFPLRSAIVTGAFAIELYIKFLSAINHVPVAKNHNVAKLYAGLPAAVQQRVSAAYKGSGTVEAALDRYKGVFVEWRYVFEKQDMTFSFDWRDLRLLAGAFETAAASQDPRKATPRSSTLK